MPEPDDNYESTLEVTISRDMGTLIRVAAEQRALMLVLSGPRLGHRLVLGDAAVDVGRGSAAGLILDADSVSRKHARIERFLQTLKHDAVIVTHGMTSRMIRGHYLGLSPEQVLDYEMPNAGVLRLSGGSETYFKGHA